MNPATEPDEPPAADRFAKSRFDGAVGETFTFVAFSDNGDRVAVPLLLTGVAARSPRPGLDQFTAHFAGPANPVLAQGNYVVSSAAFGSDELFTVPIGIASDGGRLYEVCVVKLLQDA